LFVSNTPVGSGGTFDVTVTSFNNNSIAGEAFKFDINIVEAIPEPSSSALIGLGLMGLLGRRKRS